ncbi:MAG: acetyl-CoA carboxylase biotin carboxyl carrier protein [Gemmatimonadota bacterium]|nr:acetyl-CoA carboxylase biotin carboxyl carrier protein [Gemmatimonadota bacterium]
MIDLGWLQRLIEMVDASSLDSLEISRRFGTRLRLSKSPPVHVVSGGAPPAAPGHVPAPVAAPNPGSAAAPAAGPEAEADAAPAEPEGPPTVEVVSPMVGTFYRAPAPDAPSYVEVGDRVTKGQTLCILEAMKLMNELESEVAGVVREILVENAEPVEYGQALFRIEPA